MTELTPQELLRQVRAHVVLARAFGADAALRRRPRLPTSKAEQLAALEAGLRPCARCPFHNHRTHLVFGEGNPEARLMFIGEAPGQEEDRQGRPFVGPAGQLLDKIIGAIGTTRDQVYIGNVVKCRPPNNRTPSPEEAQICGTTILRQIEIIRPAVIVALGAVPAQFLLASDQPIGRLRGRFWDAHGTKVMPTYHPAYLLRTPSAKRPVWEDMQRVRDALRTGRFG